MTFSATPQPSNVPPRVQLDFDVDEVGDSFTTLSVTRDGVAIREQPFAGGAAALTYDYEAPFGVPVTYDVEGTYLSAAAADWSEAWASLAAWTGDTGDYSVSGGKARSSVTNADITRSASGTIERVDVTDPSYVRVQFLTAADVFVGSVQVGSNVIVTGTTSTSVTGSGSFTATLVNGTLSVSGTDTVWSASRTFTGVPTKVRIVSLGLSYVPAPTFTTTGAPIGVAVDSSGNIYAADQTNSLVRKYDSAGTQTLSFTTTGVPQALTVDSSGNIFVVEDTNNLVRKYDAAGTQTLSFSTTGSPAGVAVDAGGSIYVTDQTNKRVRKYNSAGVAGITFTTTGSPNELAVDSGGNIFVTDLNTKRIRKYDSAGSQLLMFGTTGEPYGVAVDAGGNIYVADKTNSLVRKYDSAGTLLLSFTSGVPFSIALDSSANIYTVDWLSRLVRKYTATTPSVGAIVTSLPAGERSFTATATTTLNVAEAWLIHPTHPTLSLVIDEGNTNTRDDNIGVDRATAETKTAAAARTIHQPYGRRRPVVVTHGNRAVAEWTLVLSAPTLAHRNAITDILDDQAPLLLRSPAIFGWDLPDGWYSAGDLSSTRIANPIVNERTLHTIPLTPVDEPVVRQGALWTWGGVLLRYDTWADVIAANDTWLDLIAGEVT